jgi:hypothetical protein
LDDIYCTLSWRITRPLRQLKDGIRHIQRIYESRIKSGLIKPAIFRLASILSKRPRLKHIIFLMIHRFPEIENHMRRMVEASRNTPSSLNAELNNLSQRAQTIYYDLRSAIQEMNSRE